MTFLMGKIIGMINIRNELKECLLKLGRHIWYSIRPKYKKMGYRKI